jgi:hypothetical protein
LIAEEPGPVGQLFNHLLFPLCPQFLSSRPQILRTMTKSGETWVTGYTGRMNGIRCPHCRSTVALDRIGPHFQKFCAGIKTESARESSMKKFNQLYLQLQAHARAEITSEELQAEADKIFK